MIPPDLRAKLRRHLTDSLAALTDDQLIDLHDRAWQFATDVDEQQRVVVLDTLLVEVGDERSRRQEGVDDLRIAVEANGHEVWVDRDNAEGWIAFCSCDADRLHEAWNVTEAEARRLAGDHAADNDGRWARFTS